MSNASKKSKAAKKKPMLPLLIPAAPGEAGTEFLDTRVRELSLKEARDMLSGNPKPEFSSLEVMQKHLEKVRLVAWGDQLRPALYVEDRTLAPYVRSFVRLDGERGIERCPKCGTWFLQKRPDQVYDTVAHREAHRVIRWRAGLGTTRSAGKKKCLTDTLFTLSRYNFRVTVLDRIPTPHLAHSYSHNRRPCSGG